MSFLKGLESFQARMEEDAVVEETSVDVEVKVAEEVEAATQIVEEATSVIADAEASDDAAEDVEAVEHFIASIKKHGLTQQGLELMNRNGILEAISGVALPAVESLDSTGRNHEAAQAALEASEGIIKKSWEGIKKFFKMIWEKIKGLWAKFLSYVTRWEASIKRAKESLPAEVDKKKYDDKKASLLTAAKYAELGEAVVATSDSLSKYSGVKTPSKDAVKSDFPDSTIGKLGLKWDGDSLTSSDNKPEAKEEKLGTIGWSLDYAKVKGFEVAVNAVKAMRGMSGFAAAFGKSCEAGMKAADSAAKSTGKPEDEETVKVIRANVSAASKVASKVASVGTIVPRTYISACAALKACAA